MRLSTGLVLSSLLLSACATAPSIDGLHRVQAYGGSARPADEVATLFTMDGRPRSESATMCDIDGVSLERDGVCASVAWVLPGTHVVRLRYSSQRQFGSGVATVRAEAGRLYQINFSSLGSTSRGLVSVIPMYEGARLSWRNLAPGLAAGSARIDEAVPYVANAALAAPPPERVLSPGERTTVDLVVACAAAHSFDIDVLKADHRLYEPAYQQLGDFMRVAQDYLPETVARTRLSIAEAKARRDYAAALDPARDGTPERTTARDRLAADLASCDAFRRDHAGEFAARPQQH